MGSITYFDSNKGEGIVRGEANDEMFTFNYWNCEKPDLVRVGRRVVFTPTTSNYDLIKVADEIKVVD